ncbi:Cytochrome c oxidase polypeptide II [Prochlorococcus marinus str. MIT 9302]|uniref:Cytochrome c oxidase subunit 2 n=1 Tax=Prochlorococcus marinus str. MIT 9302 TaxID=74545 RepID=A0A0A2A966_PROMR|nr:Cytochrome c oxidase polypeptide II [Prochlorococcus marinus str. MIT 9302]
MNLNNFLLTNDAGLKKLNMLRIYIQIIINQLLNKNIYLILIISLVFSISFWIGFNVNLLPEEASINAPIYDELFKILFIIGLIIFIGMTIAVIYSLFKFRKRNDQIGDGIALEGNLSLEIVWTIIPSIIVLLIGLYSYNIYDRMGGMKELNHNHEMMSSNTEKIWAGISQVSDNEIAINNLSIEVSAMQFAFLFNYPKGNFISGELHVPVDQKVSMKMESKDVIHAFWVPEFRIKQDIIPGQPTILNFTPTKVGKYPIICAELCGPYHGGMRASIIVEEESDYNEWFNKNKKPEVNL